jgi:hypothetical protein
MAYHGLQTTKLRGPWWPPNSKLSRLAALRTYDGIRRARTCLAQRRAASTTATPTPQHPSDADQQNSTTHVATVPGTPAASCPRRTLYHLCYWLLAKLRFATPAHHPLATITITCCQWSCKLVAAHVLKKQRSRDSGSGTHTHADTLRAWCGQCCYLDTTGFDVMPHTMGLRYIL